MHKFVFIVPMTVEATIVASSVEEAVGVLNGAGGVSAAADLPDGCSLGRADLLWDRALLATVDNRFVDPEGEAVCSFCGEHVQCVGGQWQSDTEDHPELCSGQDEPGQPHIPWAQYRCQNCDYDGREDEFLPSDGSDSFRCSKCGSTDVFAAYVIPFQKLPEGNCGP